MSAETLGEAKAFIPPHLQHFHRSLQIGKRRGWFYRNRYAWRIGVERHATWNDGGGTIHFGPVRISWHVLPESYR